MSFIRGYTVLVLVTNRVYICLEVTHRESGSWESMLSVSARRADSMLSWTHLLLWRPDSRRLVSCREREGGRDRMGREVIPPCFFELVTNARDSYVHVCDFDSNFLG